MCWGQSKTVLYSAPKLNSDNTTMASSDRQSSVASLAKGVLSLQLTWTCSVALPGTSAYRVAAVSMASGKLWRYLCWMPHRSMLPHAGWHWHYNHTTKHSGGSCKAGFRPTQGLLWWPVHTPGSGVNRQLTISAGGVARWHCIAVYVGFRCSGPAWNYSKHSV